MLGGDGGIDRGRRHDRAGRLDGGRNGHRDGHLPRHSDLQITDLVLDFAQVEALGDLGQALDDVGMAEADVFRIAHGVPPSALSSRARSARWYDMAPKPLMTPHATPAIIDR